ncbi:DUF6207 family protein [Streptomyces sp. NPDC059517]|uniref:DUF6207 family protein n=1 Tax=Streptomyces sp. NPDC059517 TaxID=3346855 RepID=UPI00367D2D7C
MRRGRWATATSNRATRNPEQRSVRLRCLDVRQELSTPPGEMLQLADVSRSAR